MYDHETRNFEYKLLLISHLIIIRCGLRQAQLDQNDDDDDDDVCGRAGALDAAIGDLHRGFDQWNVSNIDGHDVI